MDKTKEYKDFEKLCEEQGIEFNDDVFYNVHLDSGNLFAYYSEVRKQTLQKVLEMIKEIRTHKCVEKDCGWNDAMNYFAEELNQKIKEMKK